MSTETEIELTDAERAELERDIRQARLNRLARLCEVAAEHLAPQQKQRGPDTPDN